MKRLNLLAVALLLLFTTVAIAQDTTKTQVAKGPSSAISKIQQGEVLYVSGNEVVVKAESGEVVHLTAPEGATAMVDGKKITVKDLKPGMKLQRTITTTTTPQMVTTIRTIQGTVWSVNAPKVVILTLPDGTNKKYNVPKDQMFAIDGQEKSVFDLKKGMKVTATVVTQVPETVVAQERAVTGKMPTPPEAPPMQGALLIEQAPAAPKAEVAQAAPVAKLPKTASFLPLVGLIGIASLLAGMGIRQFRTR